MKNLFKISFIAALCCTNIIAQDIEIYESSLLAEAEQQQLVLAIVLRKLISLTKSIKFGAR